MRLIFLCLLLSFSVMADANLVNIIPKLKPSIVAIGIHSPMSAPRIRLVGSGFVVQPGNKIVTNYHVISRPLDIEHNETYVVLSGSGEQFRVHNIKDKRIAAAHDIAVLEIGDTLPSVKLRQTKGAAEFVAEGTDIAFTGYPITAVLGLYPATHTGHISAITPIVIPADNSLDLKSQALRRLKDPFMIYQLDATAYPGNSGSPLFDSTTGEVIGVINQVFIKSTKEAVLSDPSGITYAIPIHFLQPLLQ